MVGTFRRREFWPYVGQRASLTLDENYGLEICSTCGVDLTTKPVCFVSSSPKLSSVSWRNH